MPAEFPSFQLQNELGKFKTETKYLQINNKNYQKIPAIALGSFSFNMLDLSYNNISEIHLDSFKGTAADRIQLENNRIDDLGFIGNMSSLKFIWVMNNRLTLLKNLTFSNIN
jgi:Leucine-rich repeat (LRR) protein